MSFISVIFSPCKILNIYEIENKSKQKNDILNRILYIIEIDILS